MSSAASVAQLVIMWLLAIRTAFLDGPFNFSTHTSKEFRQGPKYLTQVKIVLPEGRFSEIDRKGR